MLIVGGMIPLNSPIQNWEIKEFAANTNFIKTDFMNELSNRLIKSAMPISHFDEYIKTTSANLPVRTEQAVQHYNY